MNAAQAQSHHARETRRLSELIVPAWMFDCDLWSSRFSASSTRAANHVIGDADLPFKAIGIFGLDEIARSNILTERFPGYDFFVPTFSVIAADQVAAIPDLSKDGWSEQLDYLIKSDQRLSTMVQTIKVTRHKNAPFLYIRSLGALEGGAGQSAAGLYSTNTTCNAPDTNEIIEKIASIVGVSFVPRMLELCAQYGDEPRCPGIMIQDPVMFKDGMPGPVVTFNTATPGKIRGEFTKIAPMNPPYPNTLYSLADYYPPLRFEIDMSGDPTEFVNSISTKHTPREFRRFASFIPQLARYFSNNGEIPIELEIGLGASRPGRCNIALLQHRFVLGDSPLDRSLPVEMVHCGNDWCGHGIASAQWIIQIDDREDTCPLRFAMEIRALQRMLENLGEPYLIGFNQGALANCNREEMLHGFQAARGLFEISSNVHHLYEGGTAHVERLLSDRGQVFVSCDDEFENGRVFKFLKSQKVESLSPDLSFIQDIPFSHFGYSSRAEFEAALGSASSIQHVRAIKLRQPLVLIADRIKNESGIYTL